MEHRVQKLLSNYGFCSRRKAEELIQEGKVKVNDKTITIGDKASETDKITVDGKLINPQRKIYFRIAAIARSYGNIISQFSENISAFSVLCLFCPFNCCPLRVS